MNWKEDMKMLEYNIVITVKANEDMIDIGDYITYTLLEPETALNFVKGLRQSISTLKSFPNRYPFIDDVVLASLGVRCLPYKNYYVFYEVIDIMNTVIIHRVGYNRRNWKEILTVNDN
ncbi:MAG: type II toxin-antitoxin system RelE/ParE family toxin [Lachnospiraceae bacterium]|nr:type II toxin-antitoxin system RelE/ParE family toxin [Lachnospiraceae bacterium]